MYSSCRQWIVISAVFAALVFSGCNQPQNQNQNWDWFAQNKSAQQPAQVDARPKTSPASRTAGTRRSAPQDPRAQEVDASVDRYVQSMNAPYKSNYESNDFNSKIRRQQDPQRAGRIQNTAARKGANPSARASGATEEGRSRKASESRQPATIPPRQAAQPRQESENDERLSAQSTEETVAPRSNFRSVREESAGRELAEDPIEDRPIVDTQSERVHQPIQAEDQEPLSDESSEPRPRKTQKIQPPTLADIEVTAAPSPPPAAVTGEESLTSTPTMNARANAPQAISVPPADTLQTRISEQESKVSKDPNNIEEQFKLRLLYVCDGQDEKALESTSGINADILEIMRAQIQALLSARTNAQRDPALWANRQMEAIEELRNLVRARADIEVSKVVICRAITSFGVYEPIDPPNFKATQRNAMFLYVPIENFKTQKTPSGMYRTLLSIRYSVLDEGGKELWSDKIDNIEDIAREHRQDFYLGVGPDGGFVLPPRWGPGEYTVKVEVEDMLAQKINSNTTKFRIVS